MVAHVLVFPFPVQGDINCMLHFAAGLLHAGLLVTFLHTHHNRRRLGLAADTAEPNPSSPRLRFLSVPDGLPDDHPRSAGDLVELVDSVRTNTSVAYRALLASLRVGSPSSGDDGSGFPPVTCVVADGMMPFAIDVAEDLGVPALAFRTASACSFLAYLSVPRLVELGEVPVPAGADLDAPVRGVPGMEGFLRKRDLPSFCRGPAENSGGGGLDPMLRIFHEVTAHSCKARALVFNTAASLEGSALAHVAPRMRDVFAVGPLHAMFPAPAAGGALWREDDGCTAWLDGHEDRSVVYVSLGSLAVISQEQFTEFLSGLVAAGHPFLWVLRPGMAGASQNAVLQDAIRAAGRSKARVVDWAPQRDVLRHRAVGCFLTHAGWNSTLECVAEGVPTVCWPFFADQQTNSRFVGAVWGTGLDMKDVCERAVVEGMVRRAMESGELRRSAQAMAQQVRRDIAEGGSSAAEFKRLISFINELSLHAKQSG